MKSGRILLALALLFMVGTMAHAAEKLKALIVDGQNNHDWRGCTPVLKWILEDSGRFTVEVSTTPGPAPSAPQVPKGPLTTEQKAKHDAELAQWKAQMADFEKTGGTHGPAHEFVVETREPEHPIMKGADDD